MKTKRLPLFRGTDIATIAKAIFYALVFVAIIYLLAIAVICEVGG
jgi:hypothetical protein